DVRVTRLAADLSITKTMDPEEPLGIGAPITYTLTFSSNGPARGVVISDVLSSDITNIQVISSGAVISDIGHQPCCVWTVEDLEAGEGGVITITGEAQVERFVNTAFISGTSPDPNPDNNQSTVQTHIPGVIFVNGGASGANNGLSWVNAYTDLQDALTEAQAGDQIWIAEGVYRPVESGQRSNTFHLVSGVELHGGFAGGENWLHERDPAAHPTVLSGDIGTPNNPADNVYHVVTAGSGVTETAVLEGLTIIGGNANGNGENGRGAGLYSTSGVLTLINVSFLGNAANKGGGIYVQGGSPLLVNVALSGNSAAQGGGMFNDSSNPELTNVTFSHNAAASGGGLYNAAGSAVALTNAILWGNSGGQIAMDETSDAAVNHSDVQGGCPAGATCDQVKDKDPQLWNPVGEDGLAGTLDDDLRIYTTFISQPWPAIDQGDNDALPADAWDLDGDGNTTEPLPLDLSGRWRLIGFTVITPTVDMGAYEATIEDVLAAGQALFDQGQAFRLEHLQLLSADTLAQALQNYANFNDGEWYYAFCADYDQIDENGYCPATGPGDDPTLRDNLRNTLLDAIDLYRVAVGYPASEFTPRGGNAIEVNEDGGQGVLSSMTEIANDHLIFGNEFLVDATDYRFSTGGIPYADQIIAQELDQLDQAELQFELILDLVFRAFNEWDVGGYYTSDQLEQVGMASSLMMSTLNEIAARQYMLGDSQAALAVYDQAFSDQYLHLMALADLAGEVGGDYLQNGSWEMLNNLSQMRQRAQAIHDGLDFFGFAPDYVPLQGYEQLLVLTQGPAGSTGLLGTARDLEDQAREAQRTFDANESAMSTELDNLTVELDNQLFELCGSDFEACGGGLMLQNLDALDVADRRAGLALMRAQNLAKQVLVEQERAEQVITVRLGLGNDLSAAELAIGALRKERTVDTSVTSSEDQLHAGVEVAVEAYLQQEYKFGLLPGWEFKGGFKESLTAKAGYNHAWTWIGSTEEITDWNEGQIGEWESDKALKQAVAEADIEGANSAAVVKNLLLQELEALEEYKVAIAECNKLVAEGDYLAERRSRLLNMREQAIDRVASHNSHLLNPAYRIWRDSLTTQSLRAHALAAQFAYLTARAAEYELLTPYPDLGDIFRARTANDIRLFLDGLAVWVQALDLPGQLNRYPYTISLARDLWGLTDEALIEEYGSMNAGELEALRYQEFQKLLQGSVDANQLEVWFTTALDQGREEGQYLFSPNIWNNRIAGVGAPLAQNQGVWINLVTRQSGVVDGTELVLVHGGLAGGAEAYRNALGQTVYYDPDTAVPVGYKLPAGLDPENTTVVLRPGVNGAGAIANSGLINLSVAASSWTLRIPADSRGNLDYGQIEDIQIVMDTTGRALPGLAAQAEQDALLLQAGLELEPVKVNPAVEVPSSTAPAIQVEGPLQAPAIVGQIGGLYSGHVMVTSPVTIAIQVLDIELWNTDGVLTGTIAAEEGALYPVGVELYGSVVGDSFSLTSDPFTTMVAGRMVTQTVTLVGQAEKEGDLLRADYTGTITNLLPEPILVQGKFMGSRPGASGSQRLVLDAGAWSVQPYASTAITATLYTEAMEIITATRTVTFTADLGALTPTVKQTVDGQAVVTFTAGATEGVATVIATTGEITSEVHIEISELAPPIADFTATPLSGTTPLTVTFTDTSLRDPNGWTWDFGDGDSSEEQNPTHVYSEIGTYTVDLIASNALGTDSLSRSSFIVVAEPMAPQAQFSASTTSGVAPLTVTFSDQSSYSPTTWLWDFGDGITSTVQSPTHTYMSAGTFTVTLTVSNDLGQDTIVMPDYIKVNAPTEKKIYLPLVVR
ncbi:MAG: PKD domain-containing protein, partial [Anaerolineales bacterium]|nr:PKD domain-containing protein [Anaerolineales bacterium]